MIRLALQSMHNKKHATEGFEVLARMECPVRGIIGPIDFASISTMNWAQIDQIIFRQILACGWLLKSTKPIFINVSPETLEVNSLFEMALDRLRLIVSVAKCRVVIEIPEMSSLKGEGLDKRIRALKGVGCQVAMDDYGIQYSNMDRLNQHSWDYCKICLSTFSSSSDLDWLVQVKNVCVEGGVKVIIEKLESLKDMELLSIFPDMLIQGYAFSRPRLVASFEPVFGVIENA